MSNEKEDPIKHRLFADVPSSDRFFDSLRPISPLYSAHRFLSVDYRHGSRSAPMVSRVYR